MKILISGASGLIGSALTNYLTKGNHEIWHLVRHSPTKDQKQILWDPYNDIISKSDLESFDAMINLSGENIAKRWTSEVKKQIRDSRIKTAALLSKTINELKNPPQVFISSSAIGFYGNRKDETLDENSPAGKGFLPELSSEWENAANQTTACRVVNIRTGVVLSKKGAALKKMLLPFKLGLGGKLGDGQQYMSWISIEDQCRAIEFCLTHENISGPVNLTAPNPVRNDEFTKTLAAVLHRPAILPLPYFAGKLIFGEMADDLLFGSTRVMPSKLMQNKFEFKFPILEDALRHELSSDS